MGNLFFFHWQHKRFKKRLSRQKSTNSSNIQNRRRRRLLFLTHRLIPPSAPTAIHNALLAVKDTNLPDINILHLKNCTKMPHDTDILCCQPKIFH
jgi:hypothetical protein